MEAVFQGVQYDSVTNLQLFLSTLMEKVCCVAGVVGIILDAISLATLRCYCIFWLGMGLGVLVKKLPFLHSGCCPVNDHLLLHCNDI